MRHPRLLLSGLRRSRVEFCGDFFGEPVDEVLNNFGGECGGRHLHNGLLHNYMDPAWVDNRWGACRSLTGTYNLGFGWGDISLPFPGFSERKAIQTCRCHVLRVMFFDERMRPRCGGRKSQLVN
jgi:hypothetical protein